MSFSVVDSWKVVVPLVLRAVIRTVSGNAIAVQVIRTVSCNAVAIQVIGAVSCNAVAVQVIRTISRYTILDQAIGTTLGHTAFNQTIRAAFSDHRLSRVCGESVNCENRESDAEEGLAFHDGVLRGAYGLVWSRCYAGDFLRELH